MGLNPGGFMEDIMEDILSLKARFIDVCHHKVKSTAITMKDGKASEITSGLNSGVGIRILNKSWGFAYTNDMGKLKDAALKALKGSEVGNRKISIGEVNGIRDNVELRAKRDFSKVTLDDRLELLKEAEEAARYAEEVVSTGLSYSEAQVESLYLNSEAANIKSKLSRGVLYSQVFVKSDGKLQVGMERLGGTGGFEIFNEAGASSRQAGEKALRLLHARAAPSGSFTVVLDPHLTGVFIHEALGHAVEADHVIQGESIVSDKLGKVIGSELVTVYDDPTLKGSFGFYFYDSEGVSAEKTVLLENGVLKNFIHSRETASALDSMPTGNARAQGYSYPPVPRMSNTYMKSGDWSFDEIISDIKSGVYLLGSKGGEVDPARGVFQFSAEEGFIIKNGEIMESVRDVALSGETLKILKSIDAVDKQFDLSVGYCGKAGQLVPVGDGGPSIRTYSSVGGTA